MLNRTVFLLDNKEKLDKNMKNIETNSIYCDERPYIFNNFFIFSQTSVIYKVETLSFHHEMVKEKNFQFLTTFLWLVIKPFYVIFKCNPIFFYNNDHSSLKPPTLGSCYLF